MIIEINNDTVARTVTGDVLDVDMGPLLRACRDIEPRLYFKWSKTKGKWELRIKPTHKTLVSHGSFMGGKLYTPEFVEKDVVHHIKDFDNLNYYILDWLRAHDTFAHHKWSEMIDYEGDRYREKDRAKYRQELKYIVNQEKKAIKKVKEAFASGDTKQFREFMAGFGGLRLS